MRLCITGRGVGLQNTWRSELEERLRLLLGSWSARIMQAKVFIEVLNGPPGGSDLRCAIDASLIPAGTVKVSALGTDIESAARSTTRRLVRLIREELLRRHALTRAH